MYVDTWSPTTFEIWGAQHLFSNQDISENLIMLDMTDGQLHFPNFCTIIAQMGKLFARLNLNVIVQHITRIIEHHPLHFL